MMMEKVAVLAMFPKEDRHVLPSFIIWKTGQIIKVDDVLDIRVSANQKYGIRGIRYTCRVRDRQIYLYRDDDNWIFTTDF